MNSDISDTPEQTLADKIYWQQYEMKLCYWICRCRTFRGTFGFKSYLLISNVLKIEFVCRKWDMGQWILIIACGHLKRLYVGARIKSSKIFTGNIETIIGFCKTQLVNEFVTKAGKWQKQKLQ